MKQEELEKLNFEQALAELERVVRKLESGKDGLEAAIMDFEYGNKLKEICADRLNKAEMRLEKILKNNETSINIAGSNDS